MKIKSIIDDKLEGYLKSDIKLLGLPTDFTLDLKGYSKKYYGRYYIQEKRIVVFINDVNGNTLAQEVASYTIIAYLDEKRSEDSDTLKHVKDIEGTAEKLAPYINMSKENLITLLSKDAYQVELGPGGKGLTELQKEQIEKLKLPGIDFVSTSKRYYPNLDFASYTLGYVTTNENGTMTGEMGIEQYYNDKLTGTVKTQTMVS